MAGGGQQYNPYMGQQGSQNAYAQPYQQPMQQTQQQPYQQQMPQYQQQTPYQQPMYGGFGNYGGFNPQGGGIMGLLGNMFGGGNSYGATGMSNSLLQELGLV